ncbi:PHB depolymerase family esterase [Sulfitobacter sp.]|uniref:PHB depolymerase family esterase n=1 Tax=Sulfitobacter sp. TaxID=1903071 RepID=UPI00300120A2
MNRHTALNNFGTDPGSLRADIYIPKDLPKNSPLVVVLHGSTQSADSYDIGSGWSALADECGMALLFSEQRKRNNPIGVRFNRLTIRKNPARSSMVGPLPKCAHRELL